LGERLVTEHNIGIYAIINKINNKRYYGKSVELKKRLKRHANHLRKNTHFNPHLQASFNQYGENNFEFKIICFCDKDKLSLYEQIFLDANIDGYNIVKQSILNAYQKGISNNFYGHKHTEETKRVIGEASKNRKWSKQTREKHNKIVLSEQTRQKMSESQTKRYNSPQYKEKQAKIIEKNTKTCKQCGKSFITPYKTRQFCTYQCSVEARKKHL
jgi:group I intron endonuclease